MNLTDLKTLHHDQVEGLDPIRPDRLDEVRERVRTIRRRRIAAVAGAAAVLLVAGTVVTGGLVDRADEQPPAGDDSTYPVLLEALDAEEPVAPGTYAAGFYGQADIGQERALVRVPDGFTANGSSFLSSDDETRNLDFVTFGLVHPEPCIGDPDDWRLAGDTARQVAETLASQEVTRNTRPTPVRLDGHQGYYLELRFPDALPEKCRYADVAIWSAPHTRWWGEPGQVERIWVLDGLGDVPFIVDASHQRTSTQAEIDQLTEMVESVRFAHE